jgi:hypothetical protein
MAAQLMLSSVAVLLAAAAYFAIRWLGRVRGERRLRLAANIYAEREIAEQARWRALRRSR